MKLETINLRTGTRLQGLMGVKPIPVYTEIECWVHNSLAVVELPFEINITHVPTNLRLCVVESLDEGRELIGKVDHLDWGDSTRLPYESIVHLLGYTRSKHEV